MQFFLEELAHKCERSVLNCDNQGAIHLSKESCLSCYDKAYTGSVSFYDKTYKLMIICNVIGKDILGFWYM